MCMTINLILAFCFDYIISCCNIQTNAFAYVLDFRITSTETKESITQREVTSYKLKRAARSLLACVRK